MLSDGILIRRLLLMFTVVLLTACTDPKDEHLWLASMRGQTDVVRSFIRSGADPNYVRGGWSILMQVSRAGRPDVAEILIENGAKVNFKGKDGASALTIAAEHGNAEVTQILLAKGGDVNIHNDHGNTPLMYSAQYGHPAVTKLLLDSGADIRMKDADGDSALALAKLKGHADILILLKNAGANE
jgi:ankyrin repeat protein